jgi:hypothetical protein
MSETPASGRAVWIAQCLCPQRHAILAAAKEAEDQRAAEESVLAPLREQVAAWLRSGSLNPWCGLCNSPSETWRYELGRTRHRSMAEAMPELKESEKQQQMTARLWGDLPRSD